MKKKTNLKKIALMGMAGCVLMAQSQAYAAPQQNGNSYRENTIAAMDSSMQNSNKNMAEQDLLSQLNSEGKSTYQKLDKNGKALALKLANQSCKGQNDCKGLNSCKTKDNSCAGQGGCKGTSQGPFTNKNEAIKVASKHMMKNGQ